MKRVVVFLAAFGAAASLFAQSPEEGYQFVSGDWAASDGRYYQNDPRAGLAKVNLRAPQSGRMTYEFNVRYESGAEDGHGGFGLHIFGDDVYGGPSWGSGRSYLLWFNYDENPVSEDIPRGVSVQMYRSYTNSRMELVESVDMNQYAGPWTFADISVPVGIKILADGDTGEIRIYDPFDPAGAAYLVFYADKNDLPLRGDWVALRTNGVVLSFARIGAY